MRSPLRGQVKADPMDRYQRYGLSKVHGWLLPYSARIIADLAAAQTKHGIHGSLGEIGVHHGKLFVILHLSLSSSEKSFAIDVFGDQHLITDKSYNADLDRFLANVAAWSPNDKPIVIQKPSHNVAPDEILNSAGAVRMLSIDGGHSPECTEADLRLAEKILVDRGVVILDDCFNEEWPGVVTGVAQYMGDQKSRLRPFAISPNKLYFAYPSEHEFYKGVFKEKHGSNLLKTNQMFEWLLDIYSAPKEISFSKRVRQAVLSTPLGSTLRRIWRAIKPAHKRQVCAETNKMKCVLTRLIVSQVFSKPSFVIQPERLLLLLTEIISILLRRRCINMLQNV